MTAPAYKAAQQALQELRHMITGTDVHALTEVELHSLATELQILTREVMIQLEARDAPVATPRPVEQERSMGLLSRLVDAWNRDTRELQETIKTRPPVSQRMNRQD